MRVHTRAVEHGGSPCGRAPPIGIADAEIGVLALVFLLGDVEIAVLAARDVVGPVDAGLLPLSISYLRMSEAGLWHARNAIRL